MRNVPWFYPKFWDAEAAAVQQVLVGGFVNDGPLTTEFEKRVAEISAMNYGVAVTSGTAALSLALMGYGIGPSDDVIVPDLTFIATANAVRMTGANVVLADVDPHTYLMTPKTLAAALTPRTRAVIPVDVNGRVCDYEGITALCHYRAIRVVVDSCEALGTMIGSSTPDARCFSFSPNKLITTGQGGMVVTNDKQLVERLRELKDQGRPVRGTGGNDLHPTLGFNFKFTDIQAAVGLQQLKLLLPRRIHAARRGAWYSMMLEPQYPGLLWNELVTQNRDALADHLQKHSIGCRPFWFPLHKQQPYQCEGSFPGTDHASRHGLWLPSNFDLTEDDVRYVVGVIKESYLWKKPYPIQA